MQQISIPLSDIISVQEKQNKHYPLNLKFGNKASVENKKQIAGPGIYLFSFKGEVIYLGKYQKIGGKILNHRWTRHFETITLRGKRVGLLGASNPEKRMKKIDKALESGQLLKEIKNIQKINSSGRFRDTGYNTSINRLIFANKNWGYFSKLNDESILSDFSITFLRISESLTMEKAKVLTTAIEKAALSAIHPQCNKEFSKTSYSKDSYGTEDVVRRICEIADSKGTGFTHQITLQH